MRLWSIHPGYLDAKGLVALWREGLLAQKVLQGKTKSYINHPQLTRFKRTENPAGAVAEYLTFIAAEADNRGYKFDKSKIIETGFRDRLPVTGEQLEYEFKHLLGKLKERDPELFLRLNRVKAIKPHPIFYIVGGSIEP